ncbi:hypothetical protein LZ32DRAFT_361790 [Colletotrichum eremochloae]|nr:hypothetical protein LZ32DRAFT_361790 [Colletotrichum eremochloae]
MPCYLPFPTEQLQSGIFHPLAASTSTTTTTAPPHFRLLGLPYQHAVLFFEPMSRTQNSMKRGLQEPTKGSDSKNCNNNKAAAAPPPHLKPKRTSQRKREDDSKNKAGPETIQRRLRQNKPLCNGLSGPLGGPDMPEGRGLDAAWGRALDGRSMM